MATYLSFNIEESRDRKPNSRRVRPRWSPSLPTSTVTQHASFREVQPLR